MFGRGGNGVSGDSAKEKLRRRDAVLVCALHVKGSPEEKVELCDMLPLCDTSFYSQGTHGSVVWDMPWWQSQKIVVSPHD
ncbi:unnamed protein product [Urochloa humidicola]